VDIMILESIKSLEVSRREVMDKKGESSVVVGILFLIWGLVMSFSIALLMNLLISLLLEGFLTSITTNSLVLQTSFRP